MAGNAETAATETTTTTATAATLGDTTTATLGDTKLYGKAYMIVCETAKKYFDKAYSNAFYIDSMKADLKKAGNEAWKENHDFPAEYFSIISNLIIHWFDHEFHGISEAEQLESLIKNVWKFHRKYLLKPELTEEIKEQLMDDAPEYTGGKPQPIIRMCTRVMENLVELDEKAKAAKNKAAEAGATAKEAKAQGDTA